MFSLSGFETIVMLLIFFIVLTFSAIVAILVDYMITKKSRDKNVIDVAFNGNNKNKKANNVIHYILKRLIPIIIIWLIIFIYSVLWIFKTGT